MCTILYCIRGHNNVFRPFSFPERRTTEVPQRGLAQRESRCRIVDPDNINVARITA